MAEALVGRFNAAAPHGIASRAGDAIIQPLLMPLQVGDQLGDLPSGLSIRRFHPLQAPDNPVHFPIQQPCQSGLAPFVLPFGRRPLWQRCDLVEKLATLVVIHNLHRRGEERSRLLPDPACAIRHHAQADLRLGDQPSRVPLSERCGRLLIVCTWCQLNTWTMRSSTMREKRKPFASRHSPVH